jgi:hypothetical protein
MAAMSSADGPVGPGLQRCGEEEKSRRYFREHKAIERRQIRCAHPGSITDQKLMFEQKRFCGDGVRAATAEQLRHDDQQVDGQDEDVVHGANGTITIDRCKTARRGWIASHYEFASHRSMNRAAPGTGWRSIGHSLLGNEKRLSQK